jgi:hypothetical protein
LPVRHQRREPFRHRQRCQHYSHGFKKMPSDLGTPSIRIIMSGESGSIWLSGYSAGMSVVSE